MAERLAIDEADLIGADPEVEELLRTTNLLPIEAAAVVAARRGYEVSDLVPTRPLTPEEREYIGIGRSILEFMPKPDRGQG